MDVCARRKTFSSREFFPFFAVALAAALNAHPAAALRSQRSVCTERMNDG